MGENYALTNKQLALLKQSIFLPWSSLEKKHEIKTSVGAKMISQCLQIADPKSILGIPWSLESVKSNF